MADKTAKEPTSQGEELASLDSRLSAIREDWLAKIYDARLQRFLHDNDRIWSSGSLLVPLSLTPFLALSSIDHLDTAHFVFLGLASSALMMLWLLIAESHRIFQDESIRWITAIERHAGVNFTLSQDRSFRHLARYARRTLTLSIPMFWVMAGLWWPR